MIKSEQQFDVAVIGAGPAGMIAAIAAAEAGSRVVLIEKNSRAGVKLLLTGNGRCNFANAEFDLRKLVAAYGANGPFLFQAFSKFGPKDAISFFENLGVASKIENENRVFPESDRAEDVLNALENRLKRARVFAKYGAAATGLPVKKNLIESVLMDGGMVKAKNYIISTGGKSYPKTGSTGDGYVWASHFGHRIEKPVPALVPVKIKETWARDLQGVSLERAGIRIIKNGKKGPIKAGGLVFTHYGLSGPVILNLSGVIEKELERGVVSLSINLVYGKNLAEIEKNLIGDFKNCGNRELKNCGTGLMPRKIWALVLTLAGVNSGIFASAVTKEERKRIINFISGLPATATGLLGFEDAIITGGGVALKEIDDKTMGSKIVKNLFFAGEVIDVHGLTGGYNLTQCWSTGHLAGEAAAKASTALDR